jgi:hypothetical protein
LVELTTSASSAKSSFLLIQSCTNNSYTGARQAV